MYYTQRVLFIEQPVFTRLLIQLVDDDVYRKFQNELAANPDKGPIVKGSGGLRKVRLALPGRGKSGGARLVSPPRYRRFLPHLHERRDGEHPSRPNESDQI
jgi:hypothetical protein